MLNKKIKEYFFLILKGMGMGAANVIPGVSGGTIALITNIFERLIDAIKSFNIKAAKLLFNGQIKAFVQYTDLYFLVAVFAGAILSVFSLAKLLGYLFENHPVFIWAYFFGLILASVYFVGRTVSNWTWTVVITFILGTTVAVLISVLSPATKNESLVYLMLCGVVAICSMILPGLSGSFVLILMGNYELVMIDAVSNLNMQILFPVAIGAVIGLIAFSHFLSWIYKKFKDHTIATLSGFILGSLAILWPWKNELYRMDENGHILMKDGEQVIQGYERYIPQTFSAEVLWTIIIIISGILSIWLIEKLAVMKEN